MAVVDAPLFSFNARGKLANALVYFGWKGLNVVRSYVIPSNPDTAAQQTQRTRLTDAVTDWHDIGLIALGVTAWNRFAATLSDPQSGFNAFCGDHIDIDVAGQTPDMGFNGTVADDADGTFTMTIDEDGAADGAELDWGTSPTSLINTEAGAEAADTWTAAPADDVSGQRIYGRWRILSGANLIGTTGVFTVDVA